MKPTPTDHLIHWLNNHPNPHETLPGTTVRIADAHDDLVWQLTDLREGIESAHSEIERIDQTELNASGKLDRVVFRTKQLIDEMFGYFPERGFEVDPVTASIVRDKLETTLTFIEDNE